MIVLILLCVTISCLIGVVIYLATRNCDCYTVSGINFVPSPTKTYDGLVSFDEDGTWDPDFRKELDPDLKVQKIQQSIVTEYLIKNTKTDGKNYQRN